MKGVFDYLGTGIGTLLLITSTFDRIFPDGIFTTIQNFFYKLVNLTNPTTQITFDDYPPDGFGLSKAYTDIGTYLGAISGLTAAERLKGNVAKGSKRLVLSLDDFEDIIDVYEGIKVKWMRTKTLPKNNVISWKSRGEERRSYRLEFRRRDKDFVTGRYLSHVFEEGKKLGKRNRGQKLYTNVSPEDDWGTNKKYMWSCVSFHHPATFDTLAMDPKKKKDIVDDLIAFTKGKEYYARIGKPWKRGYLLYGPPGTGKSTMIAAMANFLHYDVYDLELTAVKDNTELRKLLIEISKRAIVVIEDIDCSLDLTGKRKTSKGKTNGKDSVEELIKKAKAEEDGSDSDESDDDARDKDDKDDKSKVTLSGLLNFIDGLWSACGGERIIVFTTNYAEKLDPALIRRGRMDKHIEMSYCCFEAFKVLAMNYLMVESHPLFEDVKGLLQEVDMSPADVAENLMPKSLDMGAEACLMGSSSSPLHFSPISLNTLLDA